MILETRESCGDYYTVYMVFDIPRMTHYFERLMLIETPRFYCTFG